MKIGTYVIVRDVRLYDFFEKITLERYLNRKGVIIEIDMEDHRPYLVEFEPNEDGSKDYQRFHLLDIDLNIKKNRELRLSKLLDKKNNDKS